MKKTTDIKEKLIIERECQSKGHRLIAGVDEVGRGPLAGPVVCAAVIMPLQEELLIDGINDSKKLTAKKREELFDKIMDVALAVKIHEISSAEIDSINILQAVKKCMKICVEGLDKRPDIVLCDALKIDTDIAQMAIIKGDEKSYTIGAASIVAKVYRDNLMQEYDKIYPYYEFGAHKGYGTSKHIQKLTEIGPCEIHRKTFIKNYWDETAKKPQ